jgi:predicted nuclease of predicted toxin-antitoxin system
MKILLDMNLSPEWCDVLARHGWETVHWSAVGDPRAPDSTLMSWARAHGYVVLTHDLDFGTLLAVTRAEAPSVVQIRTQDVLPAHAERLFLGALRQFEQLLEGGALVVVEEARARARVLPLKGPSSTDASNRAD